MSRVEMGKVEKKGVMAAAKALKEAYLLGMDDPRLLVRQVCRRREHSRL